MAEVVAGQAAVDLAAEEVTQGEVDPEVEVILEDGALQDHPCTMAVDRQVGL